MIGEGPSARMKLEGGSMTVVLANLILPTLTGTLKVGVLGVMTFICQWLPVVFIFNSK